MKNLLTLNLIIIFTIISHAYTPVFKDTLKVYPFDPVVVTGTRIETPKKEIPASLSVISNTVIDEESYQPLLDIVSNNVPGLFVTQRTNIGYGVASGAAGQISIRGIGGTPNTQVAVLIDGRPDIMGLFGHALGDAYFMHDVEKIEIIRGPASVLYGSNAMGGAVNIIPRHEHQKGFHIYAPITYGSFNTSQSFIRNTYDDGRFGYSLSLGYRNSDGYRTDARDTYNSKSSNLELHGQITKQIKIAVNSYLSNSDVYDPGQVAAPADTQLFQINRKGGDFTLSHKHERLVGEIKLHYNSGHHEVFDGYQSDDYTTGIILTETYQIAERARFTGGLDGKLYGGKALLYGSWIEHHVNEASVFANYHQKFINLLSFDGGLRYTNHSIAGALLIPSAGLTASLPYEFVVKTFYSEGYRNPTINELYLFPTAGDKIGPSTTDIKQEKTKNIELSIEKQFAGWFSSAITIYHTNADNLIQKGFANGRPIYQNTGDVEISGFEWEGQLLLPPRFAINWSASSANYSTAIAGSPGEKVNLAVRYKLNPDISFGIQGQWVNNLYSIQNPYAFGAPSYVRLNSYKLINLNANWELNDFLSLSAKVNNILDESYETMNGFPMPGRNFTFGITAKY